MIWLIVLCSVFSAVFFFFLLAFGSVHSPVMDESDEFIQGPAAEVLDRCTKDQLIKIAEHYQIDVSSGDKRLKGTFKDILVATLEDSGVLHADVPGSTFAGVGIRTTEGVNAVTV